MIPMLLYGLLHVDKDTILVIIMLICITIYIYIYLDIMILRIVFTLYEMQ